MGSESRRYGIVDIGSNTVHAVVYEVDGRGGRVKLMNRKDAAQLINYISKNRMKKSGIERLEKLIAEFEGAFELLECDETDYFATSSLRNLENSRNVADSVYADTGVRIRIIDGSTEAWYDYLSFARNTGKDAFVGADIGGGSVQLVRAEDGALKNHACLECGCLRMYRRFVSGILPTDKEIKCIRDYISELYEEALGKAEFRDDIIYFMGGTARAVSKYLRNADDLIAGKRSFYFTPEDLCRILNDFRKDRKAAVELVARLFPERIGTFIPGLISMMVLCEKTGASRICVMKDGVREGVLIEKTDDLGR